MLRACEFAGRLGFHIERKTQEAIHNQREEIQKASPARMTEELVQLLQCGAASPAIQWMLELGLADLVIPEVYDMLGAGVGGEDLSRMLPVLDALNRRWSHPENGGEGKVELSGGSDGRREVSDGGLLAVLLLPRVLARRAEVEADRRAPLSRKAILALVERETASFVERLQLSNARTQALNGSLTLFQRMCEPGWNGIARRRLAGRRHFQDSLFLFTMMAEATQDGLEELRAWQQAAEAPIASSGDAPDDGPRRKPRPRRRRRRKKSGRGSAKRD
jgi:tRNA nucleotidyltransferase/poly(A) polymerase